MRTALNIRIANLLRFYISCRNKNDCCNAYHTWAGESGRCAAVRRLSAHNPSSAAEPLSLSDADYDTESTLGPQKYEHVNTLYLLYEYFSTAHWEWCKNKPLVIFTETLKV